MSAESRVPGLEQEQTACPVVLLSSHRSSHPPLFIEQSKASSVMKRVKARFLATFINATAMREHQVLHLNMVNAIG